VKVDLMGNLEPAASSHLCRKKGFNRTAAARVATTSKSKMTGRYCVLRDCHIEVIYGKSLVLLHCGVLIGLRNGFRP
jgi:hypothetical protein